MNHIAELKKQFLAVADRLKEELKTIRTNHASPALLEGITVEAYGGSMNMKLMELATITNDGPTTIVIAPFDPSTVQDIERAILKSPLGITPSNQGGRLIVRIPPLSQEQREKYVKLAASMVEEYKNIIRGHRDDVRKKIKHAFEAKEISEDDKFRQEKQVDEETKKINDQIESIKSNKEKEIMTV
ncbi:MAG: ribosome-recycling factor [Candidatus Roizmanbacteria bacterium]